MHKFTKEGDLPFLDLPSPTICVHPSASSVSLHRVDNNHLLLLMIHVFRENEEQLFRVRWAQLAGVTLIDLLQRACSACVSCVLRTPLSTQMIRMSTGHMEGNLQLIYVLLTDCYVYLIRKGIPLDSTHWGCYSSLQDSQFSWDITPGRPGTEGWRERGSLA